MNKTIIKEKTKDLFEKSGVAFAGLFGSFARGEENEESDVDIMVKFNDHQEVSLLDFFALQNSLEDILGKKVDLTFHCLEGKTPFPFLLILEQAVTEKILEKKLNSLGFFVEREKRSSSSLSASPKRPKAFALARGVPEPERGGE